MWNVPFMETKERKRNKIMKKAAEIVQWFKNGDHPEDDTRIIFDSAYKPFLSEGKLVRRYRHPDVNGQSKCPTCGKKMHNHGWIDFSPDGLTVCPGDFIVTKQNGKKFLFKFEDAWLIED